MSRLVLRHADHLATFDDDRTEHRDCDLVAVDGLIAAVGPGVAATLAPEPGDHVVDARGLVVLPGLVNAHQHLYQGAFRAVPELERIEIRPWLAGLGRNVRDRHASGRFGPDAVGAVAAAVLTESLLGGQTTVADQHYFHPAGATQPYVEATVAAAEGLDVRLTAARGTLTLGPEPSVLQDVDEVVRHCAELIEAHHDPDPLGLRPGRPGPVRQCTPTAPSCSTSWPPWPPTTTASASTPTSTRWSTPRPAGSSTTSARGSSWCSTGGQGPGPGWPTCATSRWPSCPRWPPPGSRWPTSSPPTCGWAGGWHPYGPCGTPASPSGSAPPGRPATTVRTCSATSASPPSPTAPTDPDPARWPAARELLAAATRGSADCLGRPELGRLQVGAVADLAGWDLTTVDRVGVHDPVAGLVLTGLGSQASLVAVGGRVHVERGAPVTFDPDDVAARAREALGP